MTLRGGRADCSVPARSARSGWAGGEDQGRGMELIDVIASAEGAGTRSEMARNVVSAVILSGHV